MGDLYQNLFTYFVFGYFYFIIPASVCKIQTSKKDTVHNFSVLLFVYVSVCFHLRHLNIGYSYIRLDKTLPSRTLTYRNWSFATMFAFHWTVCELVS
jgi:hypothetical protein